MERGMCRSWGQPFGQSGLVSCCSPACSCRTAYLPHVLLMEAAFIKYFPMLCTSTYLAGEKIRTVKAYHHNNDCEYKGLAQCSDISMYSVIIAC